MIEFEDGALLVEPSNAELVAKLRLKTRAGRCSYDLTMMGGGPGGWLQRGSAIWKSTEGWVDSK